MGRRSGSQNAVAVRDSAARQLATMLKRYDLGEFTAQLHAVEMVEVLAGLALDPCLNPELRAKCANDVLDRAGGKPAVKAEVTLHDMRPGPDGNASTLQAVRMAAETFQELDDLVRRRVPPEEWPEHVRAAAGDAAAMFVEEDAG